MAKQEQKKRLRTAFIDLVEDNKMKLEIEKMFYKNAVKMSIWLFCMGIALLGCAGKPLEMGARHEDNGGALLGITTYEGLDFSEYMRIVSSAINKYDGLGRNEDDLSKVFPFSEESSYYKTCGEEDKIGVLLIHGLTDTPYLMRDLSKSLVSGQTCIQTRAIVLPGHATTPGNLLDVEYEDWVAATNYGVKSFIDSGVKNIFIAGFSTGGALALNYVANGKADAVKNIRGLLLFSPAIRIKSKGGFLADWHYLVSWADEKRAWFDILYDKDFAKYESFPKNAADQVYLLTTENLELTGAPLAVPVFVVISEDDDTIDSNKTIELFNNRAPEGSNLLVYKRRPNAAPGDCGLNQRVCEKTSVFPEYDIVSFSHTAIPVSMDNAHYGYHGDYSSCSHYLVEEKNLEYEQCNGADFQWGEKSMEGRPVRRLTFNPDFDRMAELTAEFIEKYR